MMKEYPFSFNSLACEQCGGKCCIGESGVIWVTFQEIEAISCEINIAVDNFISLYCTKIDYRFSLKEKPFEAGWACVFFDEKHRHCSIYSVRPQQCRTFPFWERFKKYPHEVVQECPGIIAHSS